MGLSESDLRQLEDNQRAANPKPISDDEARRMLEMVDKVSARKSAKLEAAVQAECTNILIQDGWRYLRTDPVSRRAHGKGFGELGMADGLYIRYGVGIWAETSATDYCAHSHAQVLWIEWKRRTETGADTKAAEHQKAWHLVERAKGALTLIAGGDFPATVEGFIAWYEQSGLKRIWLK